MPSFGGPTPGNTPIAVKFGNDSNDNHQITGSLYVSGSLYANEYNIDTVTTTITNIEQQGSTSFGNSSDDTHIFSGSIHVANVASGSIAGPGSYVGINSLGQMVLTASSGGGGGATINNATENEIVTVSSDTSELDAEANLTFDGATLTSKAFSALSAYGNATTISTTVTMPSDYNSLLYGPITISGSGQLTIGSDSIVKIKDIGDV